MLIAADDPFEGMDVSVASAPRLGFVDSFGAAWRQSRLLDQSNSGEIARRAALDEMEKTVGAATGPTPQTQAYVLGGGAVDDLDDMQRRERLLAKVHEARTKDPHAFPGMPDTPDKFDGWVAGRVQREAADLSQELGRSDSTGGRVLGGIAASFTDPVNLMLMPFGAARGAGILRTALTEAALGAGSTVVEAPLVAQWRDQVGLEYTPGEFVQNLAYSAAGGGAFGAAFKIAPRLVKALSRIGDLRGKALLDEADSLKEKSPEVLAAREIVAAAHETEASNPLGDLPAAREEHLQRLQEAVQAVSEGRPPSTPEFPLMPVSGDVRGFSDDDVEAMARTLEPDAFREREELQGRQDTFRRWLGELQASREAFPTPLLQTITDLQERIEAATPRLAKKYQARLAELEAERKVEISGDTPDMAHVRRDLLAADQKLRDLGPRIAAARKGALSRLEAEFNRMPVGGDHGPLILRPIQVESRYGKLSPREARAAAEADALAKLRGEYRNQQTGWDIQLTRGGILKSLNGAGSAVRAEIVANLPDLLRVAHLVESHADTLGRAEIVNVHRFGAELVLDGRRNAVKLTVREGLDGAKRHYAVSHLEVEPVRRKSSADAEASAARAGSDAVIADPHASAKSEILDHAVRALRRAGVPDAHARLWPLVHGDDAVAPSFDQVAAKATSSDARKAAGEDLAAQARNRPAPDAPVQSASPAERARQGDGGPQSSAQARLERFSDPGQGGQAADAEQLAIAAREDLERGGGVPDETPVDPLTGDAASTEDLLKEFDRDRAAIDYLQTCVPGGGT